MTQPLSIPQLYQRYNQLREQLERREITQAQFVQSAHQLRAQDQTGNWWTIDPQTGQYLTYTSSGWVTATPPAARPSPPSSAPVSTQKAVTPARVQSGGGLRGCLSSPIAVGILSFGTAGLWLVYSSIRGSYEGYDLMTPFLIGGVPFLMRLLQRPLDKILSPLYKILRFIPRPLMAGAALAVPFMLGVFFSNSSGSGYGAMQRTIIVSVVLGYVLTRRPPEVVR